VVLCLTTAAVTGCGAGSDGSAGAPGAAASGSATPSGKSSVDGTRPHPLTLTVADNGLTVRLRVGQAVVVLLASGGPMWDRPTASASALRVGQASGGYPTTMPARATFRAVRRGVSTITSVSDARRLHARPRCEIPQRLWRVVIIVR